jgi:hypothetical protein
MVNWLFGQSQGWEQYIGLNMFKLFFPRKIECQDNLIKLGHLLFPQKRFWSKLQSLGKMIVRPTAAIYILQIAYSWAFC